MFFAENLQNLRKEANLSQEHLAEQLHLSRQAVSKWEMEQSTPDLETFLKLCEVLHVSPNQLLLEADQEAAAVLKNEPKNRLEQSLSFVMASVFLMLTCICGTVILVCNRYLLKEMYEPMVHVWASRMIRGSQIGFAITLLCRLWKNRKHA